ncbi:uncharacterized protein LOC116451479 [Corvus moneduloides]|uniref:uncharacterized protein LOC116451479 n=1 Tax=Corvus moneduloides TaxID=1196302 RepID=UPI0013634896|nr:uncharacterized protein LOC116451479 [Corvus moneduloides]
MPLPAAPAAPAPAAAAPPAGPAPASCQPPGRSDTPPSDDASSVATETLTSLREAVKALRRQQSGPRPARNRPRTLPECTVIVRPKYSKQSWEELKRYWGTMATCKMHSA